MHVFQSSSRRDFGQLVMFTETCNESMHWHGVKRRKKMSNNVGGGGVE